MPDWRVTWSASLVLVAGILHLVLFPTHLEVARGQGLFFLLLAIGQVGWAVSHLRRQTTLSYFVGLSGLIIMPIIAYFGARFLTPPFAGGAEPFDFIGLATAGTEIAAGILLGWYGVVRRIQVPRLGPIGFLLASLLAGALLALTFYGLGLAGEATIDWLNQPEMPHVHDGGHVH
jgi:hypothetical protein